MSYHEAAQALSSTVQNVGPGTTPAWLTWALGGISLLAIAADVWTMNKLAKKDEGPSVHQQMADFYYQKAAEMVQPAVNVHVHPGSQAPSRYLMEEGSGDIKTDCFACASGHLAGMQGSFEQALKNMDGNNCGDKCQAWLNTAAQEAAGLLAKDWTDEKINAQPAHKRKILEKYRAGVQGVLNGMLNNNDQAVLINEGSATLDETLRFLNAGDTLDHPDVQDWLNTSMTKLATAERKDVGAFDTNTANKLRSVRQATGNKINSVDDLKQVRAQGRELAGDVNRQEFVKLDKDRLADLVRQTKDIHTGFSTDRQHVDRSKETKEEKAEHILSGLESHAGQPKKLKVYETRAEKAENIREGLRKAAGE